MHTPLRPCSSLVETEDAAPTFKEGGRCAKHRTTSRSLYRRSVCDTALIKRVLANAMADSRTEPKKENRFRCETRCCAAAGLASCREFRLAKHCSKVLHQRRPHTRRRSKSVVASLRNVSRQSYPRTRALTVRVSKWLAPNFSLLGEDVGAARYTYRASSQNDEFFT